MRLKSAILLAIVAAGGASVAFFSCGEGNGDGTAKEETASSDGKDVTQPFTLAVAGANVDVPGGAFEAGTKVDVVPGTAPAQFAANPEATSASAAIEIKATNAAGTAVTQAKVPLTVALDVGAPAALLGVEATPANLCVFGFSAEGKFLVWRNAALKAAAADKAGFLSIWLGVFQAYYCGTVQLAGASEVAATGDKLVDGAGGGGGTVLASCQITVTEGMNQCWSYVGSAYSQAQSNDGIKKGCEAAKGTFSTNVCNDADNYGTCAFFYGTTMEFAYTFYLDPTKTEGKAEIEAELKKSCDGNTEQGGKWFVKGTYTPTAADKQTEYKPTTPTGTPTGTGTGTGVATNLTCAPTDTPKGSCNMTGANMCIAYIGSVYDDTTTLNGVGSGCAQSSGNWEPASQCPSMNALGCCLNAQTATAESGNVYYTGGSYADKAAAKTACEGGGGVWTDW